MLLSSREISERKREISLNLCFYFLFFFFFFLHWVRCIPPHPCRERGRVASESLRPPQLGPVPVSGTGSHEMAVIQGQEFGRGRLATSQPLGANHEEVDERAALCSGKECAQDQGQARACEVGHSRGARARGSNGGAICGAAFNDAPNAPSHRVTETPLG
jgi:hypothetical protein